MNHLFLFIFCLLVNLCHTNSIQAKTLHAILVADTIHDIRSVTQNDLKLWQKELRVISQHTKMNLKERIFSGVEFSKKKVGDYLQNLSVDEDDSVVFYFTGHGYRTYQKKTPWPFITFEYYKQGMDIHWVADLIRMKKPQFSLVMTDCCNNYAEHGLFGRETKNISVQLSFFSPRCQGYEQLFCRAKGCIIISSCSEGQFSYGSNNGGLYTRCFFASLNHELRMTKPSWKHLLQRANEYINQIQKPICKVYREYK